MMRKSHPMGLSIIHIFFRDGLIYFVIIFAMAAWSLLTYLCFTFSLVGSAYYPTYTFTTLCACRLVLSIRATHQLSGDATAESGVQFDHAAMQMTDDIELDARGPGSRVRHLFACRRRPGDCARPPHAHSLTGGSVDSMPYDKAMVSP